MTWNNGLKPWKNKKIKSMGIRLKKNLLGWKVEGGEKNVSSSLSIDH